MTTFRLRRASGDAPRSPDGTAARNQYEGPHGPVYVGYTDDRRATWAWGPHVPDARLDFGPAGRLDGQSHTSFTDPVAVRVGTLSGEVAQPHWALLNRRRRGMVITLGSRSYLYRVTGIASPMLERGDGTPVARLGGVLSADQVAEDADGVDVALFVVMLYAVPVSEIKAQA